MEGIEVGLHGRSNKGHVRGAGGLVEVEMCVERKIRCCGCYGVGCGLGVSGGVSVWLRSRGLGEEIGGWVRLSGDGCGRVSEMKTTSGEDGGWSSMVGMVVSSGGGKGWAAVEGICWVSMGDGVGGWVSWIDARVLCLEERLRVTFREEG